MTVQLISFTPDQKDLKIDVHEDRIAALVAAKQVIEGKLAYLAEDDADAPNGVRLELVGRAADGSGTVDPTGPQVTELHNALAEKPVARFATRGAAIEKTTKVLSGIIGQREKERSVSEGAAVTTKSNRGRKALHSDDMIVRLKTDKNPKRVGTAAHAYFEGLLRTMDGIGTCTVAQALGNGASRAALAYDSDHGYIEIVKP